MWLSDRPEYQAALLALKRWGPVRLKDANDRTKHLLDVLVSEGVAQFDHDRKVWVAHEA